MPLLVCRRQAAGTSVVAAAVRCGGVGRLSSRWYQSMRLPQLRQRPVWPARSRRLGLCVAICKERRGGR